MTSTIQISRRTTLRLGWGALAAAAVAGCGGRAGSEGSTAMSPNPGFNADGFPITNEPTTITFMTGKGLPAAEDFNEVANWKLYEKMTNIHVEWGLVPVDNIEEKVTLALTAGDYPEVLYSPQLPPSVITRYGDEGILRPFNDLIDAYMPSLKKLLDEMPTIRAGMTFPDGNIYGLPLIYDPDFPGLTYPHRLWIRKAWLEQVGMEVPETVDQLYAYLQAVKAASPNGSDPTIAMGGDSNMSGVEAFLLGSFGIGNRGLQQRLIDIDPDSGQMRFWRTSEGFKQLLQFLNKLYTEGLLAQDVFSKDFSTYSKEFAQGMYGATIAIDPETIFGTAAGEYVSTRALTGPAGERSYNVMRHPLMSVTNFLITDKNTHLAETARWVDHFYSDEGCRLFFLGVEGESYEVAADGSYQFVEAIRNGEGQLSARLRPYVTYFGAGYPGIVKQATFKGAEGNEVSAKAAELLAADGLKELWPEFTYTAEEAEKIKPFLVDSDTYLAENRAAFVTGKRSFDEWAAYAAEIEKMGLPTYMEVQQAALERFEKAQ